jgi:hypothetical protein
MEVHSNMEKLIYDAMKCHIKLEALLGVCVANVGGMDAEPKATGRYSRRFAE